MNKYIEAYYDWVAELQISPKVKNLLTPISYLSYVFSDFNRMYSTFEKLQIIWCRIKGHPNGPVWYSSGFEPDMSCKDCGDEL